MVKVLGAGFGRTGTASLKVALEHLGFGPCYHMFDVIGSTAHLEHWEHIVLNGGKADWDAVFRGFQSAVDGPTTPYYREIADAYPEAKVVLTARDPEKWYQSTYGTLYQLARSGGAPSDASPEVADRLVRFRKVVGTLTWEGVFGGRFEDREHAIAVYNEHNAAVRRTIPSHRLLEFDVQQGWGPLCEFLGTEVPDINFPHVNEMDQMPQVVRGILGGEAASSSLRGDS